MRLSRSSFASSLLVGALVAALALPVGAAYGAKVAGAPSAADKAFASGDYALAAKLYQRLFETGSRSQIRSKSPDALARTMLRIGQCDLILGKREEGRPWLYSVIAWSANSKTAAMAQYLIGKSYAGERALPEAQSALTKVVTDYPTEKAQAGQALVLMGQTQFALRNYDQARRTYQRVLRSYSKYDRVRRDANIGLVQSYIMTGMYPDAVQLLGSMEGDKGYPKEEMANVTLWIGLSNLYGLGNQAKAEEYLTKVIQKYPKTSAWGDAHFHRSLIRIWNNRMDEAMEDIQGIEMKWTKPYALGEYYNHEGNYAEAVKYYAQVVPNLPKPLNGPDNIPRQALSQMAQCYDKLSETDKADAVRQQLADFEAEHDRR